MTPSPPPENVGLPRFLLRRNAIAAAYPDEFAVLVPMDDSYELNVGHINKQTGANTSEFWAWACPGANGRAPTKDATVALRAAWTATDLTLADLRIEQESTAAKYALFDAGYKSQIVAGAIRCPCGVTWDLQSHEETMAHIERITGLNR